MPVSSKIGSQKLRKNSRGHRGRGRGDRRVPREARRHFRCMQQVLHKCLSLSLAKQKAGWEVRRRRMREKGEFEGRGQSQACCWLPLPWDPAHPPAARLEPGGDKASLSQAWLSLGMGRGLLWLGEGCCLSLSPQCLCISSSHCVCLSASLCPTIPLSPLSPWPPILVSVSLSLGAPPHPSFCFSPVSQVLRSGSVSCRLWEGGPGPDPRDQRRGE